MKKSNLIILIFTLSVVFKLQAQTIVTYPADMKLKSLISLIEAKANSVSKEDTFNSKYLLAELYALKAISGEEANIIIDDITDFVPQDKLTEEDEKVLFDLFSKDKDFSLTYKDIKPGSFLEINVDPKMVNKKDLEKARSMFLQAQSDLSKRVRKLKNNQAECDKIKKANAQVKNECKIKEEMLAKGTLAQSDFCQAQNMIETRLLRIRELKGESVNYKSEYLSLLRKLEVQSALRIKMNSESEIQKFTSCIGVASVDDSLEGLNYTNFERQNIRDIASLLTPHLKTDKKELERVQKLNEKTKHDEFRIKQIADEILN